MDYLEGRKTSDQVRAFIVSLRRGEPVKKSIETPVTGKIKDNAVPAKGGIDLTPANMNLQTRNAGEEIKFHLDPAQLAIGGQPLARRLGRWSLARGTWS